DIRTQPFGKSISGLVRRAISRLGGVARFRSWTTARLVLDRKRLRHQRARFRDHSTRALRQPAVHLREPAPMARSCRRCARPKAWTAPAIADLPTEHSMARRRGGRGLVPLAIS